MNKLARTLLGLGATMVSLPLFATPPTGISCYTYYSYTCDDCPTEVSDECVGLNLGILSSCTEVSLSCSETGTCDYVHTTTGSSCPEERQLLRTPPSALRDASVEPRPHRGSRPRRDLPGDETCSRWSPRRQAGERRPAGVHDPNVPACSTSRQGHRSDSPYRFQIS